MQLSQLLSQKVEISGFEQKRLKIDQEGLEMCFLTEEKQLIFVPFVWLTPYSKDMHNSEPVFRSNCLINPNYLIKMYFEQKENSRFFSN